MESTIKTIIETNALQQLPRFLSDRSGKALIVADQNTHLIAGVQVGAVLREAGLAYQEIVLQRPQPLVPDEQALAEIQEIISPDIGVLLAVGSGTITDLTRFAGFKAGIPFISLPTAPSMDGYASPVVALTLKGFKQTLSAAPPIAIIADIGILKHAPSVMVQAGLGDLLGKYTSLADWELGRIIEDENFSPQIADLVRDAVNRAIWSFTNDIPVEEKITNLAKALIMSGEAMLAWGNSRPASGSEHHLAHYWEMETALKGKEDHPHGIKVGIAAVIVSDYYHRLSNLTIKEVEECVSNNRYESDTEYRNRIKTVFGPLAEIILSDLNGYYCDSVLRKKRQIIIQNNWWLLKKMVKEKVPKPEEIKSILSQTGAPLSPQEIGISTAELKLALQNAKEVRKRYSVFRLAEDLGWRCL
ncbi:MAG: sn-glycerol-1-phosphate dehydrogenase [Bacteroidota bacterium]